MVKGRYIPDRGDIVWLDFNPVLGHEQGGRRPALVLSPKKYNIKTEMALCCPVTKSIKGYSFEVEISIGKEKSAILVDQLRSLCWFDRNCHFLMKVSESQLLEIQDKVFELIEG